MAIENMRSRVCAGSREYVERVEMRQTAAELILIYPLLAPATFPTFCVLSTLMAFTIS
jgi:hypothetical protein